MEFANVWECIVFCIVIDQMIGIVEPFMGIDLVRISFGSVITAKDFVL